MNWEREDSARDTTASGTSPVKSRWTGTAPAGKAAGEGAPHGGSGQYQHGGGHAGLPAAGPGDAGDPLPEGPGAARHGGGGGGQAAGRSAGEAEEGAGIGPPGSPPPGRGWWPRRRRSPPSRRGENGPPPHQGVVPVQGHGHPPEAGPDVVLVAEVGELMGQGVPEGLPVSQDLRGHVDGRVGQAEEAGALHRFGDEHRAGDLPGLWAVHRLAGPAQPPGKAEVGPGKAQPHGGGPCQPEEGEPLVQGEGGQPEPFLLLGGRGGGDGVCLVGLRGHGRGGRLGAGHGDGFRHRRRRGLSGGQGGDGVAHREGGRAKVHRDQQPHQHQGPQGILDPGRDPPAQGVPQGDDGGGQDAGAKDPFHHGVLPPFPAGWRTGRRSPPGAGPASGSGR